jgi:3-methylcrotonyl-CoA carboxylase alpha subunit
VRKDKKAFAPFWNAAKHHSRVIRRLLIANRGEIAVRVARAAREMNIVPLGIYSEADANAYHLKFMDDARCAGPATASQSYLNGDTIISAARAMSADALHPGYGFLSERAPFAQMVLDAGIVFVGPSPEAMAAMGSKIEAKRRVRESGVPTVPGYDGDDQAEKALRAQAERIGFPLLIKASAGGGGRGMRVVDSAAEFDDALHSAKREALAAFGDDAVLLERYLRDPRHIEFQILADAHGTTIHLGERECSIQRRHQKVVEETPSVALDAALRAEMGAAAVRAAQSVGYTNAGTCEFMLDDDGAYYFLEMNARLQVEHPVTELVYGIDLVQWQLRIASGEPLRISQDAVAPRGWAIESRLYAEDPANEMLPSTGTIEGWTMPEGPGVRIDAGVTQGSTVSHYYDPMLAKIITFGNDRAQAIARMERSLEESSVVGVRTNVPLLLWICRDDAFRAGQTTTRFLDERLDESIFASGPPDEAIVICVASALLDDRAPWRLGDIGIPLRLQHNGHIVKVSADATSEPNVWEISGDRSGVLQAMRSGSAIAADFNGRSARGSVLFIDGRFHVTVDGRTWPFSFAAPPASSATAALGGTPTGGHIVAPMPGKIVRVAVAQNDAVEEYGLLIVLEAMKMEHRIEASAGATVKAVLVKEGQIVAAGTPLMELGS